MNLLVIVNRKAGTADPSQLQQALAVLEADADVEVRWTGDLDQLGRTLEDRDGRRVVVAGGDGTIHAVVQELHNRGALADTTLGLIPLGTGNDLATGLDLPTEPQAAAAVCLHGHKRRLDLVVTDLGHVVVNASHAGLGAAAAERSADMKPKLGALAYPLGALIAGVREAAWQLQVTLDGRVISNGHTLMVGVANGPSIGGGTRLIPPALPDDGLLDVIVVTAVAPAARLAFAVALRNAAHLDRDDVIHLRGHEVTIAGDAVSHDLDGELLPDISRCTYRVEPRAWSMLVTAPSTG